MSPAVVHALQTAFDPTLSIVCDAQFRYAVFLTVITFNVSQPPTLMFLLPC